MIKKLQKVPWHAKNISEIAELLGTNIKTGLSNIEAEKRQLNFGLNVLNEATRPPFYKRIFEHINDYLVFILIGGAILSISIGEFVDGFLILFIVFLMVVVSYVQDLKAERSLENLKKITTDKSKILREGKIVEIDTKLIVPGDVISLSAGDEVPADLRIIQETNIYSDESTLTGESLPVSKVAGVINKVSGISERVNMVFSGTHITAGRGLGIVVATGMATELGNIATLLSETRSEKTPLENQLSNLGKFMANLLVLIVLGLFSIDVFLYKTDFLDSVISAVALAVAAVPEGLPAVLTICLAIGTQKMVERQALVRKLKAVEALGSVSVICTDKTGTLTTGEMSVTNVWSTSEIGKQKNVGEISTSHLSKILRIVYLCNNNSGPTEIALSDWVKKVGVKINKRERLREFEFNSKLKRMTCVYPLDASYNTALVKGAPEVLLNCSKYFLVSANRKKVLNTKIKGEIQKNINELASGGLRLIALCERVLPKSMEKKDREDVEKNLVFVGIIGLSDPPKKEVSEAISKTKEAGIRPVMITGDSLETAKSIGRAIGLYDPKVDTVIDGLHLDEIIERKSYADILDKTIFARVTPEHKTFIVKAFQDGGSIVAMIGDGVNDAPAIKLANVGVSMGTRGSDVTKSASDLVLLDDNYKTLVTAIEEGRFILSRIRTFVGYLLSSNLAEVLVFFVAIVANFPLPLTAVMLLLINVVTDGAPALAMSQDPGDKSLMNYPPRKLKEPIITPPMWINILWITLNSAVATLVSYFIGLEKGVPTAQTMAFVTLSFLELFRVFTARSFTKQAINISLLENKWIGLSFVFGSIVTLLAIFMPGNIFKLVPLSGTLFFWALALSLIPAVAEEVLKPLLRPLYVQYKN